MKFLTRLNRPWVRFIILGFGLYFLQGQLFPEPKPVLGPIGEARLEALQQQWMGTTGRMPTPEQQARMISAELDRDMLFQRGIELELHRYDTVVYQRLLRNMNFLGLGEGKSDQQMYEEALDMRLHLGDEVVKRRLIQVMEQLLLASNPPREPSESEVQAEFEKRQEELRRPPRYSIEHLYFNRDREAEIETVIATINEQELTAEQARELSSPFLPGYLFKGLSPDQLARHFGAAFVKNLQGVNPQSAQWVGPIRSTYGLHYVWVIEVQPARDATLDEVRTLLQRDLESRARNKALEDSLTKMREQYEVIL